MRIRRRASSLFLVVVSLAAGCSDAEFPVSPTPVANANVTTVSGGSWSGGIIVSDGSTTAFNMTLIGRGLGQETSPRTRQTTGTIEVTGNFETAIGLKGTIRGVLQGTLQNGSFDGSLTADAPACTRGYVGPITESTVAWIPTGSPQPGCPLTFSVQLPRPRGPDCQYAVSLSRQTFSGNGGSGELRITTGAACTWAAESLDPWLQVEDSEPKIGSGRVAFTVRSSQQGAREGRLRVAIANQTFMISQGPLCTYSVSPTTVAVPASGGTSVLSVTAPEGCEWSAQSSVPWLTVAPASGSGSGTVTVTVQSTSGPPRSGTISVAGETIAVSQGAGCDVAVTPATVTAPAGGRSGTLQVSTATGCSWTAQANVPWIVLTPSGGNGTGVVNFTVQANTGSQRQGTISVGGQSVAITQASGCTYTVNSTQPPSLPSTPTVNTVTVTTSNEACQWTATIVTAPADGPWLNFVPPSGRIDRTGTSTFTFAATANTGALREGQIVLTGDGAISITIVIRQLGPPPGPSVTAPINFRQDMTLLCLKTPFHISVCRLNEVD